MKSRYLFFLIIPFILSGCFAALTREMTIEVKKDPFYPGTKTVSIPMTLLYNDYPTLIYWSPSCEITDSSKTYFISFSYLGDEWKFFDKVRFLIDGQKAKEFEVNKYDDDVFGGGNVNEIFYIIIEGEFLKELLDSKDFIFRISGKRGQYDLRLLPKTIEKLNEFYITTLK